MLCHSLGPISEPFHSPQWPLHDPHSDSEQPPCCSKRQRSRGPTELPGCTAQWPLPRPLHSAFHCQPSWTPLHADGVLAGQPATEPFSFPKRHWRYRPDGLGRSSIAGWCRGPDLTQRNRQYTGTQLVLKYSVERKMLKEYVVKGKCWLKENVKGKC